MIHESKVVNFTIVAEICPTIWLSTAPSHCYSCACSLRKERGIRLSLRNVFEVAGIQ